jgi:rubredoxin
MEHLIKINIPGGVIAAGDLYEILVIAQNAEAKNIRFGTRQQLYFKIADEHLESLEMDMLSAEISYEVDGDNNPNMISSYVADNIFNQDNWLKEGVYKDIFDLFDYRAGLKINVVDSTQTFVPFFTGNLNFISSDTSNYWYLYIRYPKTKTMYCWPSLVYSDDIPKLSKAVEDIILSNPNLFYDNTEADSKLLYEMVNQTGDFVLQAINKPLTVPEFHLPYYEGLNKHGNKYWLGIYRRDELFAIEALKDICNLCMQTRIGQVYVSPWKSLLIKNIELADRALWGNLLDQYRINVRHASNELNWQVEDLCSNCLDLKKLMVKAFEEADQRTYRLSFAIKRTPKSGSFGAIIIREMQTSIFEISHTRDFNANSKDFVIYKTDVPYDDLPVLVIELCNHYYSLKSDSNKLKHTNTAQAVDIAEEAVFKTVFQCKSCLTIYDEEYGDEFNGIAAGTPFETLSAYHCPTCDADKANFLSKQLMVVLT